MLPFPHAVEAGTPVYGNDEVERNMVVVEKEAYSRGLSPEAISVMLEFAMSLRMGKIVTHIQGKDGNSNQKKWISPSILLPSPILIVAHATKLFDPKQIS